MHLKTLPLTSLYTFGFVILVSVFILSFFLNDLDASIPLLVVIYSFSILGIALVVLASPKNKWLLKGNRHLIVYFVLYGLWLVIEPYISTWFDMSRLLTYSLFLTPLAFFVGSLIDLDEKRKKIATACYLSFGSLLFLWGLLHFIAIKSRPSGPLTDPNVYAGMLLFFILPVLVYLIVNIAVSKNQKKTNDYLILYLVFGLGAFFSTDSRGAFIAFGIIISFIVIKLLKDFKSKIYKRILAVIALIVVSYFAVNFYYSDSLEGRPGIQDIKNDRPVQARLMLWETSWNIYKQHSFAGIGFGQFKSYYRKYRNPKELESTGEFVHNDYLQFLLEGGVIQILFFAWLALFIIIKFIKSFFAKSNKEDEFNHLGLFVALCILCVLFMQALVNFIFYVPVCAVTLGGLLAYINRQEVQHKSNIAFGSKVILFTGLISSIAVGILAVDVYILRNIPISPNWQNKAAASNMYTLTNKLSVLRPKSLTLYRHRLLYDLQDVIEKSKETVTKKNLEDFNSQLETLLQHDKYDALTLHYLGNLAEQNPVNYAKLHTSYPNNKYYNKSATELYEASLSYDPAIFATYLRLHKIYKKSQGLDFAYNFLKKNFETRLSFKELNMSDQYYATELLLEDAVTLGYEKEAVEYAEPIINLNPCNEFALKAFGLEKSPDCP